MDITEIKELAARYVEEHDMISIPEAGELFYFQHRELPDNKVLKEEEGWVFGGYAKMISYEKDLTAKPVGKWIYMRYLSLATFPPQEGEVKLQPPHIALGKFQSPDRTIESRFLPVENKDSYTEEEEQTKEAELLQFKKK